VMSLVPKVLAQLKKLVVELVFEIRNLALKGLSLDRIVEF
jgi:hypothetical protein